MEKTAGFLELGKFCVKLVSTLYGCKNSFLRSFKQRLADMFIQEWSGAVRDKDRYEIYRSFKTIFEKEKYISNTDIYFFTVAVSQARFGVLPLNNNLHRYSVLSLDRNFAFCINEIENEHHFLFKCPMHADLRRKFIPDSSFRSLKTALEAMGDSAVVPKLVILCVCK